jgi:hypothetical protein
MQARFELLKKNLEAHFKVSLRQNPRFTIARLDQSASRQFCAT